MNPRKITALFGGTFDPIHYGHIKPILALAKEFHLPKVEFMPNFIPPHKPAPVVNVEQRIKLLTLALADYPNLDINYIEIHHNAPSYTIDTLKRWRKTQGEEGSLVFIIGEDSLATLNSWQDWQTILNYCHLIVCPRPIFTGVNYDPALRKWIENHRSNSPSLLHTEPKGYLFFSHSPLYAISASTIRNRLLSGQNCDDILPCPVSSYIKQHKLYE